MTARAEIGRSHGGFCCDTLASIMEMPHAEVLAPGVLEGDEEALARGECLAVDGREITVELLDDLRGLQYLWTSRLPVSGAEAVGQLVQLERLVVHEYRPADLRPLSALRNLKRLAIVGSSALKSLQGLEPLTNLRELLLLHNCNYSDLSPLATLVNLETLCLEGGFSKSLRVESLRPLAQLRRLERLRLAGIRVVDKSLEPLQGLTLLRSVFIARNFPKPELRALGAALPEARGEFLDSYRS